MANLFRCGGGRSEASYQNLMDQLIEETATGPIASFADGANNIPAKEIVCHINPTETGTGEKSPQNPYVIGGFTEANITQADGQTPPIISKLYNIPFGQTVYGGTLNVTTGVLTIGRGYKLLNGSETWSNYPNYNGFYLTIPEMKGGTNVFGIANRFMVGGGWTQMGVRLGAGNRNSFFVQITNNIEGVTNVTTWRAWLSNNPVQLIFPLATPLTIQLTPQEIKTLLGANNIYHDCNGDIDVTYRANGALYVQEHPITRGLMAARPTEQIQEQEEQQEEQQEEKEINKSEDNER